MHRSRNRTRDKIEISFNRRGGRGEGRERSRGCGGRRVLGNYCASILLNTAHPSSKTQNNLKPMFMKESP
jgi:hypothetical protein